jgi:hypothetical protein
LCAAALIGLCRYATTGTLLTILKVESGRSTLTAPGWLGFSRSNCALFPGITISGPLTTCSAPFSK